MSASPLILIVDDQPEFLEIFSVHLRRIGYRVAAAMSGAEGIAEAKQLRPDLILLDVQMPEMSGIEALERLRQDPDTREIKVLFLSNLGNSDAKSQLVNHMASQSIQADGYLRKTDDFNFLVEKIGAFVPAPPQAP